MVRNNKNDGIDAAADDDDDDDNDNNG